MGATAEWAGPVATVTVTGGGTLKAPKQYAIVVSDIDNLAADVCKACSWDTAKFIGSAAAREAIARNNRHFPT